MKNIINEILPIEQLTQYEKNSRTHSDEQIQSLAAAIDKFGFTQPIICDENKVILAGHGRYMAAMELGLELVPCRIVRLTEKEKKHILLLIIKLLKCLNGMKKTYLQN